MLEDQDVKCYPPIVGIQLGQHNQSDYQEAECDNLEEGSHPKVRASVKHHPNKHSLLEGRFQLAFFCCRVATFVILLTVSSVEIRIATTENESLIVILSRC